MLVRKKEVNITIQGTFDWHHKSDIKKIFF